MTFGTELTVNLDDAETIIKSIIESNKFNIKKGKKTRTSCMLWGTMGIGKSSVTRQLAKELNLLLIDQRLAQKEAVDVAGIPAIERNGNDTYVETAIPKVYPRCNFGRFTVLEKDEDDIDTDLEGYVVINDTVMDKTVTINGKVYENGLPRSHFWDGALIFFDELVNAEPIVQSACYQIFLDGAIGEWKMPDNCFAIAAGNNEEDGGNTYTMLKPLANRMEHLFTRIDADATIAHMARQGFHPSTIGFLSRNKHKLHTYDPNSPEVNFATPRTWETISDIMYQNERNRLEKHILNTRIAGNIGTGLQYYFSAFISIMQYLPNPEDILDGKKVEYSVNNIEKSYNSSGEGKIEEVGEDGKTQTRKIEFDGVAASFMMGTSLTYALKARADAIYRKGHTPTEEEVKAYVENVDNYLAFLLDETKVEGEVVVMATKMLITTLKVKLPHNKSKVFPEFFKKYGKALGLK